MPTLAEPKKPKVAARKGYSGNLRCIAYQQATNLYVAECIDLNLIVKAKSMNKAVENLREAISGYLAVACNGDIKGLVPRPSPFNRRLLYHLDGIRSLLARLRHREISRRRFEYKDCHAAA